MVKPKTVEIKPSPIVASLAASVALVLTTALMYLAPAAGLPLLDVPRLVGGVFTGDPQAALAIGYPIFFLLGALLFTLAATSAWGALPGGSTSFAGAWLKGVLLGGGFWILSGLVLPLLSAIGQAEEVVDPGLFAAAHGWAGVLELLAGHLLFGASAALICWMGHGLSPLETLGWIGIGKQGPRDEPT